jgi:hypothetical protein
MTLLSVVLGCGRVDSPPCVGSYYESKVRRQYHVHTGRRVGLRCPKPYSSSQNRPTLDGYLAKFLLVARQDVQIPSPVHPRFGRRPPLLLMPRDIAPITRMVAQASRDPHPGLPKMASAYRVTGQWA